jgi:beta-lactamase class A
MLGMPLPPTVARLMAPDRGVVSLAAQHVEKARQWRWEDRRVLPSASLIKIPILAAFWDAVERGALDPVERVPLTAGTAVDGSGILAALEPGLTPTWRDLATLMIALSDNTATNVVIDRLGLGAIQQWIDGAGLADTRLARRMRDQAAAAAGRENVTSAADMLAILGEIAAGRCVSAPASAAMRAALEAQQHGDKLGRRLPTDVRLANKTGWIGDVAHDAGILVWPGGTLVVAVLTRGLEPAWRASDLIGEVAVELVQACEH